MSSALRMTRLAAEKPVDAVMRLMNSALMMTGFPLSLVMAITVLTFSALEPEREGDREMKNDDDESLRRPLRGLVFWSVLNPRTYALG